MAAAGVAAPAAAELNYFWTYSESGGNVTNTLNLISSFDSFSAGMFADPDGAYTFLNPTADLKPDTNPGASFFAGGPEDPILVGSAPQIGGAQNTVIEGGPGEPDIIVRPPATIGTVVDGIWVSDWPGDVFPVGGINDPIFAGQFTLDKNATGEYTLRIANAGDPNDESETPNDIVQFSGLITNGRFAQRLPGDANMDGSVSLLDFGAWRNGFLNDPAQISVLNGDFNGDGTVSLLDFGIWRNGFLNAPAAAPQALSAVPEPGSVLLFAGSTLLFSRRRRSKND